MDNDNFLKKKLAGIYRKTRMKVDYAGMGLCTEEKGNALIAERLSENAPFMIGRLGAVEMHCVSRWMKGETCSEKEKEQALYAAGIFPNDRETLDRFCEVYTAAMGYCDIIGVWEVEGEKAAIKKFANSPKLIPSRSIEPYYFDKPWSWKLKGKTLLVVHPFVETIKKQFVRRTRIFESMTGGGAARTVRIMYS